MTTNINRESDIKLEFTFKDALGSAIDANAVDFELKFWTKSLFQKVTASLVQGVYTNCSLDPDNASKLIVSLNTPNFSTGKLHCRGSFFHPDTTFSDNNYKYVVDYELDINIV